MRVVVRNEKYAKRHLYVGSQPETFIYEGEQVPAYKWSTPGTICLTTGDARWPVREIHPMNIISIDDTPTETVAIPRIRVYTVEGSKGSTYTVTINPTGDRTCSCPGFGFRKSCKHSVMEFAE